VKTYVAPTTKRRAAVLTEGRSNPQPAATVTPTAALVAVSGSQAQRYPELADVASLAPS